MHETIGRLTRSLRTMFLTTKKIMTPHGGGSDLPLSESCKDSPLSLASDCVQFDESTLESNQLRFPDDCFCSTGRSNEDSGN